MRVEADRLTADSKAGRQQRLAEALRANLKRRKMQARLRASSAPATGEPTERDGAAGPSPASTDGTPGAPGSHQDT